MPNMRVTWKLKVKNRQEGKGHHHLKVDNIPCPAQTSLQRFPFVFEFKGTPGSPEVS